MPSIESAIRIRLATPSDAASITSLIRSCYGDTYCSRDGIDPAVVARRIDDGSLVYAVATTESGEHVGQAALERRGNAGLFESGRAIVRDAWRAQGLALALNEALLHEQAPSRGARFVMGRAVTSHVAMQQVAAKLRFIATGLLLGHIPGTSEVSGFGRAEQAVSTVVMLLRTEPSPRRRHVTLQGRDRERALAAYESLGVRASAATSRARRSPLGFLLERDPSVGLVHLRFTAGASVPIPIGGGLADELATSGTRLLWADVPLEHADAARAVESLRGVGLSFAATVPLAGPAGEDVVRLQRYVDPAPLRAEAIHVLDDIVPLRDEILAEAGLLEPVA